MPETATLTRAEQIERYVELEALAFVVEGGRALAFEPLITTVNPSDVGSSLTSDLFEELWPTEEDAESEEYFAASARAQLLAAKLLAALAKVSNSEILRCIAWAEDHRGSAADDA